MSTRRKEKGEERREFKIRARLLSCFTGRKILVEITFWVRLPRPCRISCGKFRRYQNSSHLSSIFWSSFCEQIQRIPSSCKAFGRDLNQKRSKSDRLVSQSDWYHFQQHHHLFCPELLTFVLYHWKLITRILQLLAEIFVCFFSLCRLDDKLAAILNSFALHNDNQEGGIVSSVTMVRWKIMRWKRPSHVWGWLETWSICLSRHDVKRLIHSEIIFPEASTIASKKLFSLSKKSQSEGTLSQYLLFHEFCWNS